MLEYFTYKKVKKHQAEKRAHEQTQAPVLDEEDERFLTRIVSAEGTPPPLPERPHRLGIEAGDPTGNTSQMIVHEGGEEEPDRHRDHHHEDKGKGREDEKPDKEAKKVNRFSFLLRRGTKKVSWLFLSCKSQLT